MPQAFYLLQIKRMPLPLSSMKKNQTARIVSLRPAPAAQETAPAAEKTSPAGAKSARSRCFEDRFEKNKASPQKTQDPGTSQNRDATDSADSALLKFMEMGFSEGVRVQLIQKIQNTLILLTNHGKYSVRTEDCRSIQVEAAPALFK